MKQSKLRRKRVIRYAILYFVLLVIFVGLIAGPIAAGPMVPKSLTASLNSKPFYLIQPNGLNNDDTQGTKQTGTGAPDYSGAALTMTTATPSAADATPTPKKKGN